MRNSDRWSPTKYESRWGRLRGSRRPSYLGVGSRLAADLVAEHYGGSLGAHARGRLLDLGCGLVPLYGTYRQYVCDVVTLDRIGANLPDSCVDIDHDLNLPLPFVDESFDTVLMSDVLEHVRLPQLLCCEIQRVLVPGGCLIGNIPFAYPIHEAPHDYFRYTQYGLRHLLESAGFTVSVLVPLGGSLEVVCDLVAKHVAQLSFPGRLCADALQRAVGWFGRTSAGRAAALATSQRYTLGYFFVASVP